MHYNAIPPGISFIVEHCYECCTCVQNFSLSALCSHDMVVVFLPAILALNLNLTYFIQVHNYEVRMKIQP